ncbi:MAG: nucleotidyltransferase family protein [Sinimarinibacterium sp.]
MTRLCTVLLAAGSSSRYGGIKLLAQIDGVSLLRRAAQTALEAGTELVVVTGAYTAEFDAALNGLDTTRIHNADWAEGMGGSIACAFQLLCARIDPPPAALVCLADQPQIGAPQLRRLIEVWREQPDCIIASQFGATQGPPCLFPRRYFDELAQLRGPQGARRVLDAHPDVVRAIALPEAAVDIDTVEDYQRSLSPSKGRGR